MTKTRHENTLAWAISEIGVSEEPPGSNKGTRVGWYQRNGTWLSGTGFAWCVAFANCAVKYGGAFAGLDPTAGAWDALARAAKRGWALGPSEWEKVVPGDLVVFNTGSGHIAVVEKLSKDTVWSVDGNASDMVKRCERPLSSVRGFVAWPETGTQVASKRVKFMQVVGGESGRRKLVVGPLKVRLPDKIT